MIEADNQGSKPMYRDRSRIQADKDLKKGKTKASWFMKGTTRQVIMIPATPRSGLANAVQSNLRGFSGPDYGTTKVVERSGRPVTAGLRRSDPFPKTGCAFGEPDCMIGVGCDKTSVCYQLSCDLCDPRPDTEPIRPSQPPTSPVAGSRRVRGRYIGQTGTSMHLRMRHHRDNEDTVVQKHISQYHSQPDDPQSSFYMENIRQSRTILDRLVWEGELIYKTEKELEGSLMNSKSEYGKGKLVRFEMATRRT